MRSSINLKRKGMPLQSKKIFINYCFSFEDPKNEGMSLQVAMKILENFIALGADCKIHRCFIHTHDR